MVILKCNFAHEWFFSLLELGSSPKDRTSSRDKNKHRLFQGKYRLSPSQSAPQEVWKLAITSTSPYRYGTPWYWVTQRYDELTQYCYMILSYHKYTNDWFSVTGTPTVFCVKLLAIRWLDSRKMVLSSDWNRKRKITGDMGRLMVVNKSWICKTNIVLLSIVFMNIGTWIDVLGSSSY